MQLTPPPTPPYAGPAVPPANAAMMGTQNHNNNNPNNLNNNNAQPTSYAPAAPMAPAVSHNQQNGASRAHNPITSNYGHPVAGPSRPAPQNPTSYIHNNMARLASSFSLAPPSNSGGTLTTATRVTYGTTAMVCKRKLFTEQPSPNKRLRLLEVMKVYGLPADEGATKSDTELPAGESPPWVKRRGRIPGAVQNQRQAQRQGQIQHIQQPQQQQILQGQQQQTQKAQQRQNEQGSGRSRHGGRVRRPVNWPRYGSPTASGSGTARTSGTRTNTTSTSAEVNPKGPQFKQEPGRAQAPEIKPDTEIKPDPEVKQEPTIKQEPESQNSNGKGRAQAPKIKPEQETPPEPEIAPEPRIKQEPESQRNNGRGYAQSREIQTAPQINPEPEVAPQGQNDNGAQSPKIKPDPESRQDPEIKVEPEVKQEPKEETPEIKQDPGEPMDDFAIRAAAQFAAIIAPLTAEELSAALAPLVGAPIPPMPPATPPRRAGRPSRGRPRNSPMTSPEFVRNMGLPANPFFFKRRLTVAEVNREVRARKNSYSRSSGVVKRGGVLGTGDAQLEPKRLREFLRYGMLDSEDRQFDRSIDRPTLESPCKMHMRNRKIYRARRAGAAAANIANVNNDDNYDHYSDIIDEDPANMPDAGHDADVEDNADSDMEVDDHNTNVNEDVETEDSDMGFHDVNDIVNDNRIVYQDVNTRSRAPAISNFTFDDNASYDDDDLDVITNNQETRLRALFQAPALQNPIPQPAEEVVKEEVEGKDAEMSGSDWYGRYSPTSPDLRDYPDWQPPTSPGWSGPEQISAFIYLATTVQGLYLGLGHPSIISGTGDCQGCGWRGLQLQIPSSYFLPFHLPTFRSHKPTYHKHQNTSPIDPQLTHTARLEGTPNTTHTAHLEGTPDHPQSPHPSHCTFGRHAKWAAVEWRLTCGEKGDGGAGLLPDEFLELRYASLRKEWVEYDGRSSKQFLSGQVEGKISTGKTGNP
ncbi:hypothetical protein BDZ91DRAFT_841539 [Kalaharituber pfeilii]|nr:hypothetical protein BDZ91DRAFT_841539 [Kalaharituber pfeilii]